MALFHIMNEHYPFSRDVDSPFARSPSTLSRRDQSFLENMFKERNRPAVNLIEEDDQYVMEAELPGMKKENLQVRIGNQGHSVTLEGKFTSRRARNSGTSSSGAGTASDNKQVPVVEGEATQNETSHEDSFNSTSFSRTVLLSRAVDDTKTTATLEDGILTVIIPKAKDTAWKTITIQ